MNEEQKKMLTEFIGECWHEIPQDSPDGEWAKCSCGQNVVNRNIGDGVSSSLHFRLSRRTFLTPDDQQACMEALVREGKWLNFHCLCRQYWLDKCSTFKLGEVPDTYGEYTSWLFRPVNEAGEAHFCALVAEFLEAKDV